MELLALATALNPPTGAFGCSGSVVPKSQKAPMRNTCILSNRASFRPCPLLCSFSMPNPEKFQLVRKAMVFVNTSAEKLQKFLPREVKEFPWKKTEKLQEFLPREVKEFPWEEAKERAMKELLFLGKESIRWSLAVFLILSPISDVVTAISRKVELLIPLGLFIGVLAAEFLKETSEELFRKSNEEWDVKTHLLGVGLIFAFVKVGLVLFRSPGQILLSHVCNGGLMQVLWLLKKSAETNGKVPEGNEGRLEPAK